MNVIQCMTYKTYRQALLWMFAGSVGFIFLLLSPVVMGGYRRLSLVFIMVMLTIAIINTIRPDKTIFENMFYYRYLIGAVLFAGLVIVQLHGSSISLWARYLGANDLRRFTIMGEPQPIRSDEWAVYTPMVLSQYLNKTGPFPYMSSTIRGSLTDVFIVYSQPVWDIAAIFKPFHWGYLLLPPGNGLAFFWYGRFIALILVSIDFGMMLTNKKKGLSVAYGFLIGFAPVIQWWFAINGLVEMFVYGQLALLMVRQFMKTKKLEQRCAYAFLIAICAGGYLLTFYPAWQVPMFYAFAALGIWVLLDNWEKDIFGKKDFIPLGIFLLVFAGGMAWILSKSYATILSVMNTDYPGERLLTGGGFSRIVYDYVGNMFFSYRIDGISPNPCERAMFFDLFPLGLILSGMVLFIQKRKDKALILLLLTGSFLYGWCAFEWPEWLAKLTLLSNAQSERVYITVGFINTLLLIRAAALLTVKMKYWIAGVVSILTAAFMTYQARNLYPGYMTFKDALAAFAVLLIFFGLFLLQNRSRFHKMLAAYTAVFMVMTGMLVNPVEIGAYGINELEVVKLISETAQENDGLWIVEGEEWPWGNLAMAAGAPTINSTNVYPNLERWELFDKEGRAREIYNRYAHIKIALQDEETEFELQATDVVIVKLKKSDLRILDVRYILTRNPLADYSDEEVFFELVGEAQGFSIYEVIYQ